MPHYKVVSDFFYQLPVRFKLIGASSIALALVVFLSNIFLSFAIDINLKDQFSASSKRTVRIISLMLINEVNEAKLENIQNIDFIEKIILTNNNEKIVYEWKRDNYKRKNLNYFKVNINEGNKLNSVLIAIDRDKYMTVNAIKLSNYKYYVLYITTLIVLLIILIVNFLIISPIDTVSNTLNDFVKLEENNIDSQLTSYDDDKSKSKIIELSKTIGLLKRSITQKNEKELQLVNIQTRLSSVLNTIGDAIITINKEGIIVMVNPAFEKIWGHKKEYALGRELEEMMPEKHRNAHNAGLTRFLETSVEHVINQNLELEALHANGTVFPIEIHISETKINDDLFFTAAIRDITQRKKIEQELVETKENVEEMLELRTHDLVTRLNELNCLYGLSKLIEGSNVNISHILKETLVLVTTACKFTDKVACLIQYDGHEYKTKNFKETKWKLKNNIVIRNKKKGTIYLYYLEEVYSNKNEQFLNYEEKLLDTVCVRLSRYLEHDLSKQDLNNANEALRVTQLQLIQAEKLDTIGTLSAGVAHEVKNPLAVIQLGIDYLRKKSGNNESIKDVINEMNEAIGRADSVIKELVNFSASNDLTLEALDVNQLIDDSLLLVKHELLKNNINVDKNYHDNLTTISGDKQKLGQVIINLAINAIHAMEKSSKKMLKIRTFPSTIDDIDLDITGKFNINDNIVVISIEDTGTGIDEDKIDRLFDPFYTTKPSGKGTGLGLTVCQNIVRLHGGTLIFENAKPGGAVIKLLFKA